MTTITCNSAHPSSLAPLPCERDGHLSSFSLSTPCDAHACCFSSLGLSVGERCLAASVGEFHVFGSFRHILMFSAPFTAIFVLFAMLGTSAHTLDVSVRFLSPFGLSGCPLAAPVGESNGFLLFQVVLTFWVAFVVINIPFQHLERPSAYSTCPSGFQGHPSPQHRVLGL